MGETIYDLISKLKDEEWDYRHKENRGNFEKAFVSNKSANSFIVEYYEHAGKEGMPLEALGVKMGDFPKSKHTASIFFLGVIIYQNCFSKDTYLNGVTPSGYNRFAFIWFLSCLFHDIANNFENSQQISDDFDTIDKLKKYFKIKNDLLDLKVDNISPIVFGAIEKYYNYRIKNGKIDHGITGGIFLYDSLVRNRELKNGRCHNERFWQVSLNPAYAKASAAIATHNIWITDEKVKKFLVSQGIEDLKPINFKESPLLFLLGLVDTLDPLKIYQYFKSDKMILKNICLTFLEKGKMRIQVKAGSPLNPKCLQEKIKDLDWLDIERVAIERGIELTFKMK